MKLPVNYKDLHWSKIKEVREEYVRIQNGKCCYCDGPLGGPPSKDVARASINKSLFPSTMFKYPIHLHHDHDTGMTIGAIHSRCNAYLWQYHGE